MSGWVRLAVVAAIVVVVLLLLAASGAWWAVRTVPEEYQRVLVLPPEASRAAGDELERHAATLTNRARERGEWQAVFAQDQINGWLAVDLPEKFPDELPPQVRDPRVALSAGRVKLYCRYVDGATDTVLSLDASAYLTGEPNEVAIRLHGAYAGALPIPLAQLVEQATEEARRTNLRLRWSQDEGDPVAILCLPPDELEEGKEILLERLELRDGEVYLSGRTKRVEMPKK